MANLRLLRDRHGLTQESAAEMAGFEYKHYQKIESGRRPNLRLDTLERLATAFGIQASQLISEHLPENTKLAPAAKGARAEPRRRRRSPKKGNPTEVAETPVAREAVAGTDLAN